MRSRRASGGWTLIEAVLATALAAVVLVIVAQVLSTTARQTRAQTMRNLYRTQLEVVIAKMERLLLPGPCAGVAWKRADTPGGAVLAIHGTPSGPFVGTPRWEPYWQCFVWNTETGELRGLRRPSGGSGTAPASTQPQAMTEQEMDEVLGDAMGRNGGETGLLLQRVTDFRWKVEQGPLYRLEIEVDIPHDENQTDLGGNRLRIVKMIRPRT